MALPEVRAVAAAHNVSSALVCLRWVVQEGMLVAVSSSDGGYDRADLAAAAGGLVLSGAEMAELGALAHGPRADGM